jgi:hypothetical protein
MQCRDLREVSRLVRGPVAGCAVLILGAVLVLVTVIYRLIGGRPICRNRVVAGFLKGTAESGFYLIWADPRSDLAS